MKEKRGKQKKKKKKKGNKITMEKKKGFTRAGPTLLAVQWVAVVSCN
jgi:hypothetical protein